MPISFFKLRAILLSLFVFICIWIKAQSFEYFNDRYDINEHELQDESYAIVETENGYVLTGISIVISGNIYWWEEKLTKLDQHGIIKYIKTYGEDSIDYFFSGNPRCFIKDIEHFYAVGKRRTPTLNWVHDEGTLMYFDENLDTIWARKYGEHVEPYDTAYLFTCLQKISQNELVIAGGWKPYGLATLAYLMKTDNIGQLIWDKSFSYYGEYIDAHSVCQTSDQGFVLGCFKQTPGYPSSVDPILIKTDSLGNQEWMKNLGGPYKDFNPMVALTIDGNILVGTVYADSMLTPDIALSRINIIKLDNEGNILWNKKYGTKQPNNYLRNIRVLDDGSIISVGALRKYNPEPDRVGWIFKTTANGDSIWYREYKFLSGEESYNYLYDVIKTYDNGLIACGYVSPYSPDTGSTDTWVIKLDSIGCDSAGCDTTVGVKEHGGMEAGEHGGLYLWPNPAKTIVNCRLSTVDFQYNSSFYIDDLSLVVYDIFGREIRTIKVAEGQDEVIINVESYPQGVYIAILKNGFDLLESRKFIVAR